jgi:hypothetical protein
VVPTHVASLRFPTLRAHYTALALFYLCWPGFVFVFVILSLRNILQRSHAAAGAYCWAVVSKSEEQTGPAEEALLGR